MKLWLFYIAFISLGTAAHVGHKLEGAMGLSLPGNPMPTRVLTGLAGLVLFAFFVWGFFGLSWWAPLVGIPVFAVSGGVLGHFILRSTFAPGIAMALSLVGIAVAVGAIAAK